MRTIDLLASLPFVDEANLGVTGCSGGGTQSAYLGAADPRIKAASIACYMSTMKVDYTYAYVEENNSIDIYRYRYKYKCLLKRVANDFPLAS